jgi:hypothetical protein
MSMITIIGRGHSGTRAVSRTLAESGVYMGSELNKSSDLIPPEDMYEACRVLARYVRWRGGLEWDWSALSQVEIPAEFETLIRSYLHSVLESTAEHRGWKIPETTLVFPWIARMFPQAKYIFWVRNPCDCILAQHKTDDMRDFGIAYPETEDEWLRRAISWQYQYDLVRATPKPEWWIEVRFEDFVLRQEETLARLEAFLGFELARIPVLPEAVDRWKQDPDARCYGFLRPAMREYGYEGPDEDEVVFADPAGELVEDCCECKEK